MREWQAKILRSKKSKENGLPLELQEYLDADWKIKGFSSDEWYHYTLLIKEGTAST